MYIFGIAIADLEELAASIFRVEKSVSKKPA
jgi:hypothetical protein